MRFFLDIRFYHLKSFPPPPTPFLSGFGTSHGELLLTLWRLCRILKGCRSIITSAVTPIVKLLLRPPYCYRPQTKFAKVMLLHLSVSHSVHRGGVVSQHASHVASQHALHISRPIPKREVEGSGLGGGGLQARPPPSRWLTLRAVCILLEYILVYKYLNSIRKTFEGKTFLCFFYSQKSTIS